MTDPRVYPDRPFLAVSAAIVRAGRILVVRRGRMPSRGIHTFPGGVVEIGETLEEAVAREVREETSIEIETAALAGHREMITRDPDGRVSRHFVILPFAARWVSGEFTVSDELEGGDWLTLADFAGLETTKGLREIAEIALRQIEG